MKKTFYTLYLKRVIDFNLALVALIILSPLLLLTLVFQILFNGFPIFFTQERIGKDEKYFKLLKFRTMNNKRDLKGALLPDHQRKTLFGSFLRATSIDELPSLINILKGEMAIIGPRPLLVEYLPLYNQKQKQRHLVRPGLSGLAQVKGRNSISWEEKFNYDIYYLKKISLFFDIKIIVLTIFFILTFRPVDKSSNITMEKFNGKN